MVDFVHLRTHSEYSLKDGILSNEQIIKNTLDNGGNTATLSDLNNMINAVKFYEKSISNNIKPIIACDVFIDNFVDYEDLGVELTDKEKKQAQKSPHRILLIAKNNQGYKQIMKLISRAHIENDVVGISRIKKEWLEDTSNIIALSGGQYGEIESYIKQDNIEAAKAVANVYKEYFSLDNLFLELHRDNNANETKLVEGAVNISSELDIPVVATHPIHFNERDDFLAHEVKHCAANSTTLYDDSRPHLFTREQYYKSYDEMNEMFSDIPEALENASQIALQCNVSIDLKNNYFPNFDTDNPVKEFRQQARNGLIERFKQIFPDDETRRKHWPEYFDRLKEEISIVEKMGFVTYFLVVSDFIKHAKEKGIPVGPGRGSGAGSLVAYALNITNLDPIKHDLIFERFLNPERVSLPDFDIDFCIDRRDEVIDYVRQKYGQDAVCQIGTLNTLAARNAIRSVGRVLQQPYGMVDKVAKMISDRPGIKLNEAYQAEERLQEKVANDKNINKIYDIASKIEGSPTHTGKHAAGVLISPSRLDDFVPLQTSDSLVVSQYDKDDVEKAGLVKYDFLGLKNLTIIDRAIKNIKEQKNVDLDIDMIETEDPNVFKIYKEGNTQGIFQCESSGMTGLAVRSEVSSFEEITAMIALYRPGPLDSGMVEDYVERKHGRQEVTYPHPKLESILKSTYGVIVYQEQVMRIAQDLAGYTLGQADLLRRAMGKKKPEEMAKQKQFFIDGCVSNSNMGKEEAAQLFDLVDKFAGYGFNKSHSAAYALISYQTAYLKTYYPAQYMSALLELDSDNTNKLDLLIKDTKKNGIEVKNPNINSSTNTFSVVSDNELEYNLAALKGVGAPIAKKIIETRQEKGEFTSFHDFCTKVGTGTGAVTKQVAEALIRAGAFDALHSNRAALFSIVKPTLENFKKAKAKAKRQADKKPMLNGLFDEEEKKSQTKDLEAEAVEVPSDINDWSFVEKLNAEKMALGFYFSDHPYIAFKKHYGGLKASMTIEEIQAANPDNEKFDRLFSGIISRVKVIPDRNKNKMAFVKFQDDKGEQDITLFSSLYEEVQDQLSVGSFMSFKGRIQKDFRGGDENKLLANDVIPEEDYNKKLSNGVHVALDSKDIDKLNEILDKHIDVNAEFAVPVTVYHPTNNGSEKYNKATLNDNVRIEATSKVIDELKSCFGEDKVKLTYFKDIKHLNQKKWSNDNKKKPKGFNRP